MIINGNRSGTPSPGTRPRISATVGVVASGAGDHESAAALAAALSLPLLTQDAVAGAGAASRPAGCDFLLILSGRRLALIEIGAPRQGSLQVDFECGPTGYRRVSAGSRRQPLARAVGLRHGTPTVLDATAGLGRDAFLLACWGCTVIAVERNPVVGALLQNGLSRGLASGRAPLKAVLERLTVITQDARNVLTSLDDAARPDVVYIDPMFPPAAKSALAKKEMRLCRRIVGDDDDAADLLAAALQVARRRVVVKRHTHAPPLLPGVTSGHRGRRVRYDVYRPLV